MIDSNTKTKIHFQKLRDKWNDRHREIKHSFAKKHAEVLTWAIDSLPAKRHVAAASLSAMMLVSNSGGLPNLSLQNNADNSNTPAIERTRKLDKKSLLALDLATALPREVRPLNENEEKDISTIISDDLGMKVTAEMNGIRLNRSYGLIGGEQHLERYPGDTLAKHASNVEESNMFLPSGMAPGLGAWRHFAKSEKSLTQKDIEREKYYIAAPTFLAPGFNENVKEYKDFFKYRKMIVVNPKTGAAVVVVIGDAGPGQSTGKHLGGSPEVMHYLDLGKGPRKGAVLYYFIDDPGDTIPLGPLQ
jgi:hypothetical protein